MHVRDELVKGTFELMHVPSEKMLADILTKALPMTVFCMLRDKLIVGSWVDLSDRRHEHEQYPERT